jgi:hypothetical protein
MAMPVELAWGDGGNQTLSGPEATGSTTPRHALGMAGHAVLRHA